MKKNRTIVVSKDIYNKPIRTKNRFKIELYLPPSDIPMSISPEINKMENKLILTFNYLDSEKEKELFNRDDIKLIVGFYSGKPLRIEIKGNEKVHFEEVRINHTSTLIGDSAQSASGEREKANLELTGKFLKKNAAVIAKEATQSVY